jgi:hypothetical protein
VNNREKKNSTTKPLEFPCVKDTHNGVIFSFLHPRQEEEEE